MDGDNFVQGEIKTKIAQAQSWSAFSSDTEFKDACKRTLEIAKGHLRFNSHWHAELLFNLMAITRGFLLPS